MKIELRNNLLNNYSIKNDRKHIFVQLENFFCIIIKNILYENKMFQLKLILLENFSNLIEKTWLYFCIYI